MSLVGALARPFTPLGRWILGMEHAFERARASDKAVDDTRLRIFFVLALFGFGYVTLALGATRAAVFSPWGHGSDIVTPAPNARAELTDRNGAILAIDEL
jgi:cell division protein FtsI (penicillin-binding protein 3)